MQEIEIRNQIKVDIPTRVADDFVAKGEVYSHKVFGQCDGEGCGAESKSTGFEGCGVTAGH